MLASALLSFLMKSNSIQMNLMALCTTVWYKKMAVVLVETPKRWRRCDHLCRKVIKWCLKLEGHKWDFGFKIALWRVRKMHTSTCIRELDHKLYIPAGHCILPQNHLYKTFIIWQCVGRPKTLAHSPDLNPIENLGIFLHALYVG